MRWFDLLFPLGMILSPALFILFMWRWITADGAAGIRMDRMRQLRQRLWLWTLAAAAVHLGLYL